MTPLNRLHLSIPCLVALGMLAWAGPASAANPSQAPMTIKGTPTPAPAPSATQGPLQEQEALVKTALNRVPQILSAQRTLAANQSRLEAAKGGYWPSLGINAGATRSNSTSTTGTVGDAIDVETATASVQQDLFNFGRTAAQVDAAAANVDAANSSLRQSYVDVAHTVRTAYINWIVARGLEDQTHAQVVDDQRLFDQTQAFYKAGTRARLDVTRARTTLEQARAANAAAHTATDQARATLATALAEHRLIEGHPAFAPIPPIAKHSLDDLEKGALANHPALASAKARVAAAHAAVEAADAANKPDLSANASGGGRARDLEGGASWAIGANLAWPLYNGGAYQRLQDATRQAEDAANADLHSQEDQILLGVDNAYLALQGASVRLPATNAELASAKENLFQAEGRYRAGVGSIIEVSDAQALLANAEADQLQAQAAYHRAIADLIAATGQTTGTGR